MTKIRQPIVTIVGHVDHGKTTLLDSLRGSNIVEKEAGRITQKIYFSLFPLERIKEICPIIEKKNIKLEIPGLLFIDTPGHAAFTNLRKRGGSLADLAILVIDINEGIMPQTSECLQILKENKTPFIIALNKIDNLSGWKKRDNDIKKNIESQNYITKNEFDEKFYSIVSALQFYNFDADLFYNIQDYTKKVAICPISAKSFEGVPELLLTLCGLCQKFLKKQLELKEDAKGIILEVKKEKTINYLEAILYDGKLKTGDEIAIASFDKPIITKIRTIEEIIPLENKFKSVNETNAATGLRLHLTNMEGILAGMPFCLLNKKITEIEKEFNLELKKIETDKQGIIIKAESLGSLEALIFLLKQSNIKILKAGVGNITKNDIILAKTNEEKDPLNSIIVGFNVSIEEDALDMSKEVKIILGDIVYKIIEEIIKSREEKQKEIERKKLMELTSLCKLQILHQYVFRNSNPAIFGVRVLYGKLKIGTFLIDDNNNEIGRVKSIQKEKNSLQEVSSGEEVAISLPGLNFERQLKNINFLYSELTEREFKKFKENKHLLSEEEIRILQEIASIKRKEKITWGV
ncbi:MAG: translation initiation factor IF-2 [Candidatus Pacearchaeota archaeon]